MLAGCTGSDEPLTKAEYEDEVLALVEGPGSEAGGLFFAIVADPLSDEECTNKTSHFHEVLKQIVERVEQLHPPPEVEELQRRFLASARESVTEVGRAVADVRNGQLSCGFALNRRIYGLPSTQRAEQVIAEYHELGYLRFLLGR